MLGYESVNGGEKDCCMTVPRWDNANPLSMVVR